MAMHILNYSLFKSYIKYFLLLVASFVVGTIVYAQPIIHINNKGERPSIDVAKLPLSAFKQGKLHLKFLPTYRHQCNNFIKDENSNALFSVPSIDSLNKLFHVVGVSPLFHAINSNKLVTPPKIANLQINTLHETGLRARHQQWGFDLWFEISFAEDVDVKEALKAYQQTKVFEVVEPVYKASIIGSPPNPFIPVDPIFQLQWNLQNSGQANGTIGKDISMVNAWGITTGDTDVIVSVHDNAVNLLHPDLAQNIAKGKSFNFVDNNDSLTLNEGHGSHCAGIIAAVSNNNVGMSGVAGGNGSINSGARLMSCETFGPNNTAGGFAESIVYAADNGAAISSNSWGYDESGVYEEAVLDAIDYFCAYGGGKVLNGGVVVCAGGNNGNNWRIYPAGYSRTISVVATNNLDKKTIYSNYGDWMSLSAPGGEGWFGGGIYSTENNGYASSSGTSFAGPHVAGVAALVASVLKGKASGNDVREIILSTTDNNYPLNPNFSKLLGTGRLNAYSAVLKAQSFLNKSINSIANFTSTNNCNYINVSWSNASSNLVVVAVNSNTNIRTLVDGNIYKVGDTLIGGGVIIYVGNGKSYGLPITDSINEYNFKIWSVSNNNQYSFSKTTSIYVKPVVIAVGESALKQNFDFPPLFPTKIWHGTDTSYGYSSWLHTANDTSSTGAGDDYSMCLYNYQYNTKLGAVDTLSGPQLRVKGADSVVLTFWHAYQFTNKNLPYSDTLEVVISTDCGKTYTSLWKKGGKDLATVKDTANKQFYPFGGINRWKQDTINLSAFINADKVLIGFRGYNGEGNNLFLDNINVSVQYKTDIAVASISQANGTLCDKQATTQVLFKNMGINKVTTCNIGYQIDGGSVNTINYKGSIGSNDSTLITLPVQTLSVGVHSIKVFSYLPNNVPDNNTLNDTLSSTITILPTDTLPFAESFESDSFPINGWQTVSEQNSNFNWRRTTIAASNGGASVFVQNFINYTAGDTEDLVSPPISITHQVDSVFLLFDVAAAIQADSTSPLKIDTLQIEMTKDCGISWTTIYKKWGTNLQTSLPLYTEFVPTASQWRTDSVNISSLVTAGDKVRFRFRNKEKSSNDIYMDNVRCYTKSLHPQLKEKGFLIYPNPFKNTITIQHYLPPTNLQRIIIYSTLGARVKTFAFNGNANTTEVLNLMNLPAGYYEIQLIYSDKKVVEKAVKM